MHSHRWSLIASDNFTFSIANPRHSQGPWVSTWDFLIYLDVFRCGDIPTMPGSSCKRDHWHPKVFSFNRAPTCRRHPFETQPSASRWLCSSVQAKTIPEWGCFTIGINTVSFHNYQSRSFSGEELPTPKKQPVRSVSVPDWKFESRWLWNFCFWPTAGAWNFSDYQTWQILGIQTTVHVASKIWGKFQIFFREFFGPNFSKFRASPRSTFRARAKDFQDFAGLFGEL